MKTKKLAAMLITVSMVLGSMSGLVWADTETDSTEPSTEQVTEITDETSEETESSEETEAVEEIEVVDEDAEETEASEEIDETIETEADEEIAVEEEGDVYEAVDDAEFYEVHTWQELIDATTPGPNPTYTHIRLANDIDVEGNAGAITFNPIGPGALQVLDLNHKSINMHNSTVADAYFFTVNTTMTIMNGELVEGHCTNGAGAIQLNGGVLTLDDVKISDCSGNYGAIYIVGGTLKLVDEVTIIENTSVYEGAGIRCNPYGSILIDGTVVITNNYSDKSIKNYHVDNLHFVDVSTNFNPIVIGDNVNRGSYIRISGVKANTVITSGFNGRNFPDIFIYEDRFTAVVNIDGEVSSAGISYISRQWNGTEVEEVPGTILNDLTHITSDAFDPTKGISGTIYIYEDMVVADRIYVTEGETLNIVIADGVTLTCNGGIGVHSYVNNNEVRITSSLYIYGQTDNDTGILIANSPENINCAGIGGSTVGTTYYDCGEVYISGCTVRATGNNAAGIGGITSYVEESATGLKTVYGTNFIKVEIYGGNVTAIGGGDYGDDIGTGMSGSKGNGTVAIYGGTVTLPSGNGYQIGLNSYAKIYLAPYICVLTGTSYSSSAEYERERTCVNYHESDMVIAPCEHPNEADASLYSDIDDDTHTYHCPYCLSVVVQPHTYDNNICICGHSSESSDYFIGHAMQLSGQIGLQFFINLPTGAEATDYRVTFDGVGIDTTREYQLEESTKTDVGAFFVQLDINPIQMADHFTPILHLVGSEDPVDTGRSYCAMDYITWARSETSRVDQLERDILENLADYGYRSQLYLSVIDGWTIGNEHERVVLGRDEHSYTRDTYREYTRPYASDIDDNLASWCSRVTMSVRFGDQLMLRAIFYPAPGQTFSRSDFSVFETSNYSVTKRSDGAFVVTIRDQISALNVLTPIGGSDPAALYHFQVKNGSDIGEIAISPMSYAYSILMHNENSEQCRNLVCALYDYAYACNEYIAHNTSN